MPGRLGHGGDHADNYQLCAPIWSGIRVRTEYFVRVRSTVVPPGGGGHRSGAVARGKEPGYIWTHQPGPRPPPVCTI